MTNHTPNVVVKPVSHEKPVIRVTDLSQKFTMGDETSDILKKVSFEMHPKSFNIIYGASGSGKSTLLNILTGLQSPTTGSVEVFGNDMYKLGPDKLAYFRANEIGIVYQQNYWVKSLNVLENVAMPLYFSGHTRAEAAKVARESLEQVGMGAYEKKHPSMLSGGEQQRIAVARALVNSPKIIIADEPTGSLDSKNGDMVIGLLRRCQSELGRTIVLVTHNMEYLPYADHLLNIQDGVVTDTMDVNGIRKIAGELIKGIRDRIDLMSKEKR